MNFLSKIKIIASFADNVLVIQNGKVQNQKGKVKAAMLHDLNDLLQQTKVQSGYILFKKKSRKLSLNGIPKSIEQRVRNVWNAHYRNI